jgi:plasmid replication initiation protein
MKYIENIQDNKEVRIHNELASGRGDFSACMLDILFYLLANIKKNEKEYLVRVKDIEAITQRKWDYTQFKESTQKIGSKMFEIETEKELVQLWLFQRVRYIKGTGSFEVKLSEDSIPYLMDLKTGFTSMQLKSILTCDSKYAKRLYMLSCRWRGRGEVPTMEIDELKKMLGIGKHQYKQFSSFKTDVLEKAKKQINDNTDVMFDYRLHKLGRKYHRITILINYRAAKQLQISFDSPIEDQKTYTHLIELGFSEAEASAIAKNGAKNWEINKLKFIEKAKNGKVKLDKIVPYMIAVYRRKGIIPLKVNEK